MPSDPSKLKIVKELNRSDILFSLARVPATNQLFVGSSDFAIHSLDPMTEGKESKQFTGHQSYVAGLTLAGDQLISGAYDGRLGWWDVETQQSIRMIDAHDKWIRGVEISPDDQFISTVSDDMVCRVWNAQTSEMVHELRGHAPQTPTRFPSMLFCSAFSPDGQLLATADKVGHVVIWDVQTGSELATLDAPGMYTWDPKQRIHSIGGIRSLAFTPDSKRIACGGIGQIGNVDHLDALARIEIFDWQTGERTHELAGDTHKGLVERLVFDPEGNWLFATGGDHGGFIKFIDLEKNEIIKQDKAPMHVHDVAINEQHDTIYAAGHGKVIVWELKPDETTG